MMETVRRGLLRGTALGAAVAISASAVISGAAVAQDEKTLIGLVVKDLDNPFFVKMIEGAQKRADELGTVEVQALAGQDSGDNQGQVTHIENLINSGAKGILLTASDSAGIVATVEKAKEAGLLVIALDTQLDPPDAAQATFATDNNLAGKLIGQWAAATLGEEGVANARIAAINDSNLQTSVDVQRNQGFFEGFGVELNDASIWGDEDDPRVVGQDVSLGGREGGIEAMENLLVANDSDITVLHTINEPTAEGAYLALQDAGVEDNVLIVSVDGSCAGVKAVEEGIIGATAMQFPLLMADLGVEAVAEFAASGTLPEPSEGLTFTNTGVALITDAPVDGLDSLTSAEGLEQCWGELPA